MLSIRQTSFCTLGNLLLLLLLHPQLSPTQTLAATIPPASVAGDDVPAHLTARASFAGGDTMLMLPADVDLGEKKEKEPKSGPSPASINWHPSTIGGHAATISRRFSVVVLAGEGAGDGDNKLDGTTQTEGDYLKLWSVNYEEAINRADYGRLSEEEEEEDDVEEIPRTFVMANKWKRHLISGPTFDNCPPGTRWVGNECREILLLDSTSR